MDGSVLGFALTVSVGTGLVCAAASALHARRTDVRSGLHGGDARASAARGSLRFRRALVAAQFGLCTVLLVTAGLLVESLANLTRVELGFNPSGVVTARASLQDSAYTGAAAAAGLFRSTLDTIRRLPGVEHASVASNVPVERGLNLPIHSPRPSAEAPVSSVDWRYVTEGYFETMQIPLREGRLFDTRDTAGSRPVALVNEAFASRFLDAGRAVGSEVRIYEAVPELRDAARTIVGVVGTVKTGGSLALPPVPTMFVPVEQVPAGLFATVHSYIPVNWLVRTTGSSPELLAAIEETLGRRRGTRPGVRAPDDGPGHRSGGHRGAIPGRPVDDLRAGRPGAGGGRTVRGDGVRGPSTDARGRHPPRARRAAGARAAVVPGPGVVGRGLRRDRGAGRHLLRCAPPAGFPVWHSTLGCADSGRGRRGAAGRGADRRLGAGSPRGAYGPDHGTPVRIGSVAG